MSIRFANILVPTDFSDASRPAVECALGLIESFNAQLHCLHVVDDACQYWSAIGPESLPLGPPPEEILELGRTRMTKFCERTFADLTTPAISNVVLGRPFLEIITYAKQNRVDLIVMSTHGRGAIAHVLLGSTTEKVVRKASCAVLTVRTPEHTFVMP